MVFTGYSWQGQIFESFFSLCDYIVLVYPEYTSSQCGIVLRIRWPRLIAYVDQHVYIWSAPEGFGCILESSSLWMST